MKSYVVKYIFLELEYDFGIFSISFGSRHETLKITNIIENFQRNFWTVSNTKQFNLVDQLLDIEIVCRSLINILT